MALFGPWLIRHEIPWLGAQWTRLGYFEERVLALLFLAAFLLLATIVLLILGRRRLVPLFRQRPVWLLLMFALMISATAGVIGVAGGAFVYRQYLVRSKQSRDRRASIDKEKQAVAKAKSDLDKLKAREAAKWKINKTNGEISRIPYGTTSLGDDGPLDWRFFTDFMGLVPRLSKSQSSQIDNIAEEADNQIMKYKAEMSARSTTAQKVQEHRIREIQVERNRRIMAALDDEQVRHFKNDYCNAPVLSLAWSQDSSCFIITMGGISEWRLPESPEGRQLMEQSLPRGARLPDSDKRAPFTGAVNSKDGYMWSPKSPYPDNGLFVWNPHLNKQLNSLTIRPFDRWHTLMSYSSVFLNGTRQIMSVGDEGQCLISDYSGKILKSFSGHKWGVRSLAVSPNGRLALTGGIDIDHTIRLWDTETTAQLRLFDGFTSGVYSLSLSPDCRRAAAGTNGVAIMNLEAGTVERRLYAGEGRTLAVAWSPDGKRLAAGGRDNFIRIWDMSQPDSPPLTFAGHNGHVYCIGWTLDGTKVISGGFDHLVRVFNSSTGRLLHRFAGHSDMVKCLAVSPNGKMVASGAFDGTTIVWDLNKVREPEIQWQLDLDEGIAMARRRGYSLLVYCDPNLSPNGNPVLDDDRVRAAVGQRIVPVFARSGRLDLVERLKVTKTPAVRIYDPMGILLTKLDGPFSAAELVATINSRYTKPLPAEVLTTDTKSNRMEGK